MSVQPLEDILADLECEESCVVEGCDLVAQWSVWASHVSNIHTQQWGCLCDTHYKRTLENAEDVVRRRCICPCGGFTYVGQLSDHFRAIKL